MTATVLAKRPMTTRFRVPRTRIDGAVDDKLFFAQVREDPMLEIDTLKPRAEGTYIVVSSGGCTALSLLARGAGRVIAVDMNATQNHITELKAAALAAFDIADCCSFLGGSQLDDRTRVRWYGTLRPSLSSRALNYWDNHTGDVAAGVINAGVSERFIRVLARLVTASIHPRDRVQRFLGCSTITEQVKLYEREWDNVRWRLLFKAMLNRWTLNRAYDPAFFTHVENDSFSSHFHGVFERSVTKNLISDNYFLCHMLTGVYPAGRGSALPPYLDPGPLNQISERGVEGLELVDGSFQDYLWQCDDSSVDGIVLSNIGEWMSAGQRKLLFTSAARVVRPGGQICFRNFVGHTEVPDDLATTIVEDRAEGARAMERDRSCVQSRFAPCVVQKPV